MQPTSFPPLLEKPSSSISNPISLSTFLLPKSNRRGLDLHKEKQGHLPAIYANRRRKASRIVNAWTNQKRKKKERKKKTRLTRAEGRAIISKDGRGDGCIWPISPLRLRYVSIGRRPRRSRMTSAAPRCKCKRVGSVSFDSIIIIDLVIEITI